MIPAEGLYSGFLLVKFALITETTAYNDVL